MLAPHVDAVLQVVRTRRSGWREARQAKRGILEVGGRHVGVILNGVRNSGRGYGGYYESVRAGYTRDEARVLLERSVLPPGAVRLDSTWFVPILTIASKGRD